LSLTGRFLKLIFTRAALFIYLFVLVVAAALFLYYIPIADILAGLMALAESSVLTSIVSFAQWVTAGVNLRYTALFIVAAPLPFAIISSLLFSGALGSFASGMETALGFPAKYGMDFFSGFRRRFIHFLLLVYITVLIGLLLIFIWVVAAVPLAIIRELEIREMIRDVVLYATLAATALFAYICIIFLRVYSASFMPALYSGAYRPVAASFSFAGRNFFRVSRNYLLSDILLALHLALYYATGGNLYILIYISFVFTLLTFFGVFAVFDAFAADGYGFEEQDDEQQVGYQMAEAHTGNTGYEQ